MRTDPRPTGIEPHAMRALVDKLVAPYVATLPRTEARRARRWLRTVSGASLPAESLLQARVLLAASMHSKLEGVAAHLALPVPTVHTAFVRGTTCLPRVLAAMAIDCACRKRRLRAALALLAVLHLFSPAEAEALAADVGRLAPERRLLLPLLQANDRRVREFGTLLLGQLAQEGGRASPLPPDTHDRGRVD